MRKWLKQWLGITALEQRADGLEGLVAFQPAVVNEARTIAQWRAERDLHPVGSPKHTAFTNRLRSMGLE